MRMRRLVPGWIGINNELAMWSCSREGGSLWIGWLKLALRNRRKMVGGRLSMGLIVFAWKRDAKKMWRKVI